MVLGGWSQIPDRSPGRADRGSLPGILISPVTSLSAPAVTHSTGPLDGTPGMALLALQTHVTAPFAEQLPLIFEILASKAQATKGPTSCPRDIVSHHPIQPWTPLCPYEPVGPLGTATGPPLLIYAPPNQAQHLS